MNKEFAEDIKMDQNKDAKYDDKTNNYVAMDYDGKISLENPDANPKKNEKNEDDNESEKVENIITDGPDATTCLKKMRYFPDEMYDFRIIFCPGSRLVT